MKYEIGEGVGGRGEFRIKKEGLVQGLSSSYPNIVLGPSLFLAPKGRHTYPAPGVSPRVKTPIDRAPKGRHTVGGRIQNAELRMMKKKREKAEFEKRSCNLPTKRDSTTDY